MGGRFFGLYAKYLIAKIRYCGRVRFNGFTVVYTFPGSFINFNGRGIMVIAGNPARIIKENNEY